MESIRVRCCSCGKEVESRTGKTISCGCSNMLTISGDVISANDMSKVIMLSQYSQKEKNSLFSKEDLEYQELRKQRKIRKLDFEVR
tara:strand:- start:606 stop:863 length:258 start_codon:yes stop_codon:yes gene_type:complete